MEIFRTLSAFILGQVEGFAISASPLEGSVIHMELRPWSVKMATTIPRTHFPSRLLSLPLGG